MKKSPNQSPLHEEHNLHLPPQDHPSTSSSSQPPLQKPLLSLLQEQSEIPTLNEKENTFESPESKIPSSEGQFKSPGRNGAIVAKHLESEWRGSIGMEEPGVENRMGSGMGKMMRVESGHVRREMLRRAEIGVRVLQVALCLVSFSVMAADRTTGWAGDYFDRYLEYRYCFSVNVIASAYSAFQVCAHIYYMLWKRRILSHSLNYSFDFLLDQVLAYLLLSASSSAATRHDDWVSMFGSDKFTDMLIGSITTSFFAFLAFAISSIISAYKLFGSNP